MLNLKYWFRMLEKDKAFGEGLNVLEPVSFDGHSWINFFPYNFKKLLWQVRLMILLILKEYWIWAIWFGCWTRLRFLELVKFLGEDALWWLYLTYYFTKLAWMVLLVYWQVSRPNMTHCFKYMRKFCFYVFITYDIVSQYIV